ncbi:hypothetical protein NHQ30_010150 [Ciborinia camelliae]|nr:hypothetical protein NHQ30_010150 [Ciborinia camelliae]
MVSNSSVTGTSQAQTLQNEGSEEQLSSQTPTTDGDRSKTPDSYLCSIIKSFDDYNIEPAIIKGKGVAVSPSPSPDKLQPTKPIDFLKDLSPDMIPECQTGPSNQSADTTSSIFFSADEPERPERIYREEKRPIITIREVTSDSDSSLLHEDPIAPSPPTWQDAAKSRNELLKSRARLPDRNSARYIQEFNPLFVNQTEERQDNCQGLETTPFVSEDSDQERIARSIKQTVDKMTKNLHLSSFSEAATEEWDEELPKEEIYPSELEYKYSLSSDQNLDNFSKTVENLCIKTLDEAPAVTMIRKNISSFKNIEFLAGPIYVRYPQSETKWRHVQYFPTGSLALSDIRKQNKGEYSDTITYCPEESSIYVHLWGKLPKPEKDLSVRVRYPETKTRWARTEIYDNSDLAMNDMNQENRGEFSEIRYNASERCFYVYTWGDVVEAPDSSVRVDYPETQTQSARTQIYSNENLALADICQQSRGEFSEVRYNASERRFRAFAWGDVIDSPDSYVCVDFLEPEIERNVRVDYPETKTRWARTQMYENEDLATADISRINNGEYSKVIYSSSERRFRVEAQPEVVEPVYRAREPAWKPTLSPLNDRDEDEHDLPDFSDLENDFQLVATESLRSSSPEIQPQEGIQDLIGENNSGSNDMSLCVEAGTPQKSENDFFAELFMGNNSDRPSPLLRGSKQILQYLDTLDEINSTSKIQHVENDFRFDRRTATKAWAESKDDNRESESTQKAPQAAQDMADELFAQASSNSIWIDEFYSDDDNTSLGIEIVEKETRKGSKPSITPLFEFSRVADASGEDKDCGIPIVHEVSDPSKDTESIDSNAKNTNENIIFDFDRDVIHRRERSNAICGENMKAPLFQGMLNNEDNPVVVSSVKSNESIYIQPFENADLYEENAGCGDSKSSPSQVDENIAAFSSDAFTVLLPEPTDALTNYKVDTHLYSMNLTKSAFEEEAEEAGFGSGLLRGPCAKVESIRNASACTASSVYSQPGLENLSVSASNTEQLNLSTIDNSDPKDLPIEKENKIEDVSIRVETVSQEYIDNEVCPPTIAKTDPRRVPTLVNIFHSRGMMSSTSTRPFLDRCSPPRSPLPSIPTPKLGERHIHTPRIVTPSGAVYSPAKEEQKISNPILRVQTPGNLSSGYMSGDETETSEGFGEVLEKMKVSKYCLRSSYDSSLDDNV